MIWEYAHVVCNACYILTKHNIIMPTLSVTCTLRKILIVFFSLCYSAGATEADPTHLHPQQKNLRMAQYCRFYIFTSHLHKNL